MNLCILQARWPANALLQRDLERSPTPEVRLQSRTLVMIGTAPAADVPVDFPESGSERGGGESGADEKLPLIFEQQEIRLWLVVRRRASHVHHGEWAIQLGCWDGADSVDHDA